MEEIQYSWIKCLECWFITDGRVLKIEHKDKDKSVKKDVIMAQQDMRNADYYVS